MHVKRLIVPYSVQEYDQRKLLDNSDILQNEEEIKLIYSTVLEGHLGASNITFDRDDEARIHLPVIHPPTKSTDLTHMWFSIMSQFRNSYISSNDQIKQLADKECQVIALLNA